MNTLISVIEGIFDTKDVEQSIKDTVADRLRKDFERSFQNIADNKTMLFYGDVVGKIPEIACSLYPNAYINGRLLIPYINGKTEWVTEFEGGKNIPQLLKMGGEVSLYTDSLKNITIESMPTNHNLRILSVQSKDKFPEFKNVNINTPDHNLQILGKSSRRIMISGIVGEVRHIEVWLEGPALSAHILEFRSAYQQKVAPKMFIDSKLKFMDAEIVGNKNRKVMISKNPPITFSGDLAWEVDGWWYAIKNV